MTAPPNARQNHELFPALAAGGSCVTSGEASPGKCANRPRIWRRSRARVARDRESARSTLRRISSRDAAGFGAPRGARYMLRPRHVARGSLAAARAHRLAPRRAHPDAERARASDRGLGGTARCTRAVADGAATNVLRHSVHRRPLPPRVPSTPPSTWITIPPLTARDHAARWISIPTRPGSYVRAPLKTPRRAACASTRAGAFGARRRRR